MINISTKAKDKTYRFVIALDGPSASGKGLIGKLIAEEFNMKYVQSSILYRGLAYLCMKKNINIKETQQIIKLSESAILEKTKNIDLNQEDIGNYASKISIIPEVRRNLNKHLIRLIQDTARIIMEGRDIGTVVAPDADLKIFITASTEKRAFRRYKQLRSEGKECILSDVLELLKERDLRDSGRKHSPLIPSDDSFVIDTSELSPEEVIAKIKSYIG